MAKVVSEVKYTKLLVGIGRLAVVVLSALDGSVVLEDLDLALASAVNVS